MLIARFIQALQERELDLLPPQAPTSALQELPERAVTTDLSLPLQALDPELALKEPLEQAVTLDPDQLQAQV